MKIPTSTVLGLAAAANVAMAAPKDVRPLPGQLDTVEMANSNHPEGVRGAGVALSTLPPTGANPAAHLDHPFQGDFRIFAHHKNTSDHPLYQAIALYNPASQPVSYQLGANAVTTTSEGPYHDPPGNTVTPLSSPDPAPMSGPGEVTAARVMFGSAPAAHTAPQGLSLLAVKPVKPGEEVSSLLELHADGPLYTAVVFTDSPPQAGDVWNALKHGVKVAGEPDAHPPSPPGTPPEHFIYGRVAGVQQGTTWKGTAEPFELAPQAKVDYALDTKATNTLGTGQQQAAPLLARYPDSAYVAHGNYGVSYDLALPLHNPATHAQKVEVSLLSPPDAHSGLRSFRGVVAVEDQGLTRMLAVDEVESGEAPPLWQATLQPGERREVRVHMIYAADNTPPQLLRIASP